MECQ